MSPAPPRSLLVVSALVVAVGSVVTVWGAWRIGVSFDEPFHVLRLRNFLEQGWFLLDDDLHDGAPGEWVDDAYVYAPVTALLLHGLNVVTGQETAGVISTSAEAYAVRHLGVALIGLVGVAATAVMGRLLLRTWGWGLVAAATLLAVPMWTGHSMFNLKDVPVATGYTLLTLGLMLAVRGSGGRRRREALTSSAASASISVGVLLAIGTRPGIWPGLLVAWVLAALVLVRRKEPRRLLMELLVPAIGAVVGLALLYPAALADPVWPRESALASSNYAGPGQWWYIPVQVIGGMPTLLMTMGLIGLLGLIRRGASGSGDRPGLTRRWGGLAEPEPARLTLVLAQALLLPTLALVRQSHLYDGLRQLLFAAPAVVLVLLWGIRRLLATPHDGPRRLATVLACAAIAVPTLVQVRMFPYSYAYASVVVDGLGAAGANDYWRTSVRELVPQIPQGEFVICSPVTTTSGVYLRASHEAGRSPVERSRDCRTDVISPILPFRQERVAATEPVAETFLAVSSTYEDPGENCRRLGIVTRPRHLTEQRMSAVYRCDLVLEPYPSGGAEFDPTGTGSEYLLGGWTAHPAEQGIWLLGDAGSAGSGSLGFTLPPGQATAAHVLSLDLDAPHRASVLVNNRVVGRVRGSRAVRSFPLTAAQVGRFGSGRLVVTLRAAAGRQGVRLFGVGLSAVGRGQPQEGSG